jgi:hypothetical protein
LTELRDQQEGRLVACNRNQMELRREVKALHRPAPRPDKPDCTSALDLSKLSAFLQWPKLPVFGEPQPILRTASGEFRPVLTELRQEGGLMAANLPDGTHFWGKCSYRGDRLIRFSVGATSHFELRPENIPESATGRYHSAPPGDANGSIGGMTGPYSFPLHADDKWCHCFRIFRHALWQNVNGQWRCLGERYQNETTIHLENVWGIGQKIVPLAGWMASPEFDFTPDRTLSVWAQVEIRFDVELEGDAVISFGDDAARGVVVRVCGWWARSV